MFVSYHVVVLVSLSPGEGIHLPALKRGQVVSLNP